MVTNLILDSDNNKQIWDKFVKEHPDGWLYHFSEWKELIELSFPHIKGEIFVIINDESKDIQAALPLYVVKSWLTGKRMVSIPFATICEPLYSNDDDLNNLLTKVIEQAKKQHALRIEIRTFNHDLKHIETLKERNYYKFHEIDLTSEISVIQKKFHRSCVRQRINRALKSELELKVCIDLEDFQEFYRLYIKSRKRLQLPPMPFRFFENLWKIFLPKDRMTLLLALYHGQAIAGLILLKYKNRVSAEFAASDETFKQFSPNHFLFWHAIKRSHNENYNVFDFGRTSPVNEGLMNFKNNWGTDVKDLKEYFYFLTKTKNTSEPEKNITYRLAKTIMRLIPQSMATVYGNICYKHLG